MGTKSVKAETCTCNTENILLHGHLASPKDFFEADDGASIEKGGGGLLKEFNLTSFT